MVVFGGGYNEIVEHEPVKSEFRIRVLLPVIPHLLCAAFRFVSYVGWFAPFHI